MNTKKTTLEDMELNKFHWKITVYSSGGPFCDGYIISIIAIALTQIAPQLGLSNLMTGIIGASALIGIFIGGFFGYLTDIIGRKIMYLIDLIIFVVASLLQFFVGEGWQLLILRLILGIAIGADYPIATSLLAEYTPKKHRGLLLSFMDLAWYLGTVSAYIVSFFLIKLGDDSWRWILSSSSVPAVIVLLLRMGTPESPRWLASKGRMEEARNSIRKAFGEDVDLDDIPSKPQKTSFMDIFRNGYGKRTIFVSLFWILQTAPAFAMITFTPYILTFINLNDGDFEYLGSVIINSFSIAGLIPALFLVGKIGRRPLLIWPFFIAGCALLVVGVVPLTTFLLLFMFIIFTAFIAASSVLQYVYPNELFPTEIRATGMGFGTSMSRIGASLGTLLVPISLNNIGMENTMIIGSVLCFIGFIISLFMAPETKNQTLTESSTINNKMDKVK